MTTAATASHRTIPAITVLGNESQLVEQVMTAPVRELLVQLHRRFNARRLQLLDRRATRQKQFDRGELPDFLTETADIRAAEWRIAAVPADLQDRRVEITGPVDRKTIINALNAPVQAYMADFEDSSSPTWRNMLQGQINLRDACNRSIVHYEPLSGKRYQLNERTATLIVRPRGWHLDEKHVLIDGEPMSASLFDFAVFFVTNCQTQLQHGTGPYFYLPKMESHLEARLWNEVFTAAQSYMDVPVGTIKATVLIETILAAFEMDEILFELREHIVGLNCGRWDYIFSFIKKFRNLPGFVLPDRGTVTMNQPFLKAYCELLIKTCHRRGAHAMGGMAAQIPIRDNAEANDEAMARVLADKQREVKLGHDGTWIAHPGLAPVAYQAFTPDKAPNQLQVSRADVQVAARDLLRIPEGQITEAGMRTNIRVGLQYVEAWLEGNGCVPINNLMEDAATAEICRAQLWQWIRHRARTTDGQVITAERVDVLIAEELDQLRRTVGNERYTQGSYATAARLLSHMVTSEEFAEFLTLPAYELLP